MTGGYGRGRPARKGVIADGRIRRFFPCGGLKVETKVETTRQGLDWQAIEADYRAGRSSVRDIAGRHSVSHTAINKRARAEGWRRSVCPCCGQALPDGADR